MFGNFSVTTVNTVVFPLMHDYNPIVRHTCVRWNANMVYGLAGVQIGVKRGRGKGKKPKKHVGNEKKNGIYKCVAMIMIGYLTHSEKRVFFGR